MSDTVTFASSLFTHDDVGKKIIVSSPTWTPRWWWRPFDWCAVTMNSWLLRQEFLPPRVRLRLMYTRLPKQVRSLCYYQRESPNAGTFVITSVKDSSSIEIMPS